MKRRWTIVAMIIACAVLLFGSNVIAAQEDDQSKPLESVEQPSLDVEEPSEGHFEGTEGYGDEGRRIGTPVDVDRDLDYSFPKRDYVLPRLLPQKWFQWKEDLYDKHREAGFQLSDAVSKCVGYFDGK